MVLPVAKEKLSSAIHVTTFASSSGLPPSSLKVLE